MLPEGNREPWDSGFVLSSFEVACIAARVELPTASVAEGDMPLSSDSILHFTFDHTDEEASHAHKIKTRHVGAWSSSLTGFVNSKTDSSVAALLNAKWWLVALAVLFALVYGSVAAWRVISMHTAVEAEMLAEQEALAKELHSFVTVQLNGKVEDVYRLSLAPAVYSPEYFATWARADPDLSQVRFINTSGWEVIRIDAVEETWAVSQDLQDKSDRDYARTSLDLEPRSVFISSIDLNVEYGVVQIPYQPVYRVASPVFSSLGNVSSRTGFVIANLDAKHLWQRTTENMLRDHGFEWDILDLDLHWLASSSTNQSILYGQSLPERAAIAYQGPLQAKIQADVAAGVSEVRHEGLATSLVVSYALLSPPFSGIELRGENGLVLLIRAPEGASWAKTQSRLAGFYAAIVLAYVATVAMCGVIVISWQATKEKEAQNKQSHEFLSSVSHDLRSPLHVMSNALHLLETEDLLRKYEFRALQAAVESMLSLLSNTVFIYRSGTDKHIPPQKRNLTKDMVTLCEVSAFLANEKDLCLDLDLDERLPSLLMINWNGVKQILVNLLSNAIKFTVKGGITVRVKVCDASNGQVCLRVSVADSGPGMPQGAAQVKHKAGSPASGLGLGICERIAASLDATLEVESAPGHGTTFLIDNLVCDVIEPPKRERAWKQLARKFKVLHFVFILDGADAQRIRPNLELFLRHLRRHLLVTVDCHVAEDINEGCCPDIPPRSVVWFGIPVLKHEVLMNSVVERIKASGSSAAILSFICGSLSLSDTGSMINSAFPHTIIYPPWTPDRLAVQLTSLEREKSSRNAAHGPSSSTKATAGGVVKEEVEMDYAHLTVLVVDDMAVNRKIMKRLLKQNFGIAVDEAGGGAECIEKLEAGSAYNLILMDLHMPGMDGIECAKAIRQLEERLLATPGCTIMGLSASVMEADRDACMKAGMNDYYCKPMSIEQLTRVLTDLLCHKNEDASICSNASIPSAIRVASRRKSAETSRRSSTEARRQFSKEDGPQV
eukprot:jgi/Tetstr1/448795/TSEL_036029.t1